MASEVTNEVIQPQSEEEAALEEEQRFIDKQRRGRRCEMDNESDLTPDDNGQQIDDNNSEL